MSTWGNALFIECELSLRLAGKLSSHVLRLRLESASQVSRIQFDDFGFDAPDLADGPRTTESNQIRRDSIAVKRDVERVGSMFVCVLVLIQQTETDSVLRILSPIAMSFTVSMNAELIIPG